MYSRVGVPNKRPPLINFSKIFHPGHSYSNPPPFINFWENGFESSLFLPDSAVLASFTNIFHPGHFLFQPPPLIKFRDFFHPPRLFRSPRLLGTREYWLNIFRISRLKSNLPLDTKLWILIFHLCGDTEYSGKRTATYPDQLNHY